jgi:hypothetical protein
LGVIVARLRLRSENRDPLFLWPKSAGKGRALPKGSLGKKRLIAIMEGGCLDGVANVLEAVNLRAGCLQLSGG